jgi:hypothetical protein
MAKYTHPAFSRIQRLRLFLQGMMSWVRWLQALIFACVILLVGGAVAYLAYVSLIIFSIFVLTATIVFWSAIRSGIRRNLSDNEREVQTPSRDEFEQSFERSVQWMLDNRKRLVATDFIWMWWFVNKAALLTGDSRLLELVDEFKHEKYQVRATPMDFGYLLLEPGQPYTYNKEGFSKSVHFLQMILYGLTGNKEAGASKYIREQYDPDFSDGETARDIHSACLTHQVMGLHEIQTAGYCQDADDHDELLRILQLKMRYLLALDTVAGDVYIQRVMMLVMTGARDQVNPAWFRRILDTQQPDGGWLPYQSMMRLTPGFRLGWNRPYLHRDGSTFHPSSQGLLLAAMMMRDKTH